MRKDYLIISGKQYRVASNVMGVALSFHSAKGGKQPEVLEAEDWVLLLSLSIYYGEKLEGRESDFSVDSFCLMEAEEGVKIIKDFQEIYLRQHESEAPAEPKKA